MTPVVAPVRRISPHAAMARPSALPLSTMSGRSSAEPITPILSFRDYVSEPGAVATGSWLKVERRSASLLLAGLTWSAIGGWYLSSELVTWRFTSHHCCVTNHINPGRRKKPPTEAVTTLGE